MYKTLLHAHRQEGALHANTRYRQALSPLSCILCVVLFLLSGCGSTAAQQGSSGSLVIQQMPSARLTYVAIGASDTFGIGTADPQAESWPADLSAKLGSGTRLINLGIPGIDAHNALNVELPVALDSHANLITVWLAVNDLADNVPVKSYTQDMNTLLSRLQAADPHARILVANVPDVTLLPHFQNNNPQLLRTQITAYNTAIASLVQRHHVLLVDLYARWQDLANHPEYISSDGFHPNALGYNAIANIFYQVLQGK